MKLLTIQDLACYGKCSGAVALPVLSAMGIETTLLPTAVLTTHSAFEGFVSQDMLPLMEQAAAQWKTLGLSFDAIYVGYMTGPAQLDFVYRLLDQYPQARVLVDPVMGDNGRLHHRMTPEFIAAYRTLCRRAYLLTPNMTEACALTGRPFSGAAGNPLPLLQELNALGAANVVVTGCENASGETGAVCLDSDNRLYAHYHAAVPGHYHGTGDVFASVCIGALLRGLSLWQAMALAADFTAACIQNTANTGDAAGNHWHGLRFEACLPLLQEWLTSGGKRKNV